MPQPEQPAPSIQARIQRASTMPETLAACFDAFEIIRLAASACVDDVPELFAAFMTTAGAAVEGREAITAAPSLPPGPAHLQAGAFAANASLEETTTALAGLGELLADRLTTATAAATLAADRTACQEAADAARQIRHLMARDDDAPGFGDFLAQASGHIAAAVSIRDELQDEVLSGAVRGLDRVVTTLARYIADVPVPEEFGQSAIHEGPACKIHPVQEARIALRRSAQALRPAAAWSRPAQSRLIQRPGIWGAQPTNWPPAGISCTPISPPILPAAGSVPRLGRK